VAPQAQSPPNFPHSQRKIRWATNHLEIGPEQASLQRKADNPRLEVIVSSLRLDLGSAAVDEQFGTRDETGVIRRQKQRHLSNFLGFANASHWDSGHNPRNHVC